MTDFSQYKDLADVPDGIYYDMPAEIYFALPAINRSQLAVLAMGGTPKHFLGKKEKETKQTKVMALGHRVHAAILEPDLYEKYQPLPPDIKRRAGAAYEKLLTDNPGVEFLPPSEWGEVGENKSMAEKIRDEVNAHPEAAKILGRLPLREVSYIWTDPQTGIRCKARADIGGEEPCELADIKTTSKRDPYVAARSAFDQALHVQCAFYGDGWLICHGIDPALRPCPFHFIFVETSWPHLVSVCDGHACYDESTETTEPLGYVMNGRAAYQEALRTVKQCTETGIWPGHGTEIMEMVLPKWAHQFGDFKTDKE